MSHATYFESLTDDTVRIVVRHVSDCPRHPTWFRFLASANFFPLLEAGGLLASSVTSMFDGLCTRPSQSSVNGLIDETSTTWLHMPTLREFQQLNWHVRNLRIRSLELTRDFASTMTPYFLSVAAQTVTSLSLLDFGYDQHAGDVGRIMAHLGPNLTDFTSKVTNRSIVWAVREYCTKLVTLRLIHIGGFNRVPVSLTSVGNWEHLGSTLQTLALVYLWGGCEADAVLVQNSFPRLRSLSVEFGAHMDTSSNPDAYVDYFRGIDEDQLEHCDFSILPYSNICAMRQKYPNTRFDGIITGHDTCAQLAACGEALRTVTILTSMANKEMAEAAAEKCGNIEKLVVPVPLRVPMRSLRTLNLTWDKYQDPEFLNYVASNSGMLETLTVRGESPSKDVWARVANANRRLRRVRLVLQSSNSDVAKLVAIIEAFAHCPDLHEVAVKFVPERPGVDLVRSDSVRDALARFRVRKTHFRIGGCVCLP